MRKKGRMLTAGVLAFAWWSLFYPELCFTEETCEIVSAAKAETTEQITAGQSGKAETAGQNGEVEIFPGILRAVRDEVVISSSLLEWCGERLSDGE